MDTLRSYFSRILPNNHTRKGSGRWKRGRSNDRTRGLRGFADGPLRSASTSQMDLDSGSADDSYYMPYSSASAAAAAAEPLTSFSSFDKGPKPKSVSDLASGNHHHHQYGFGGGTLGRECARTPPPSKPPRKDQVFSVELITGGVKDLGIEVDAVAISSRDRSGSCDGVADHCWGSRTSVSSPSASPAVTSPVSGFGSLPPTPGCVMRVVGVKDGSVARLDGRVKVNDELIDVNGKSLLRESKESVR